MTFSPGQIVVLKTNQSIRGAVVSVITGKPENRVKVFIDGETRLYYESQLIEDKSRIGEKIRLSCDEYHAFLSALQILNPGLATLYSLNAARIEFIPYQFRPVLRFIRSERPRLLIADGVGVGKTIEAGLILRELQARRDVKTVLVICPRPLVTERKWQLEMKRFEERFLHLDGSMLRYCIRELDMEGYWPEQYRKVIVPYSLFDEALLYGDQESNKGKRNIGLLNLDPPPRFDLVIVDEAHHIRNQNTLRHEAVRFFCDHAEAVLFLTATPIQLGNQDLFVLLKTLRPDLILDEESFVHITEPNPYINSAVDHARRQEDGWKIKVLEELDRAAHTSWGESILSHNPKLRKIRERITQKTIEPEERVRLITDLEELHTLSGIINRTRRRDIGAFTIRKPETVSVDFLPDQRGLHDHLLEVQAEIFSRLHGDINVKFMMTTIRRQAASCLFGLVPFLEEILNRHVDELTWEVSEDEASTLVNETVKTLEMQIESILVRARNLGSHDPKLDALRKILHDKQLLTNNKIMVFSSFRHTLHYLYHHLKKDGYRLGLVHGGVPDEERIMLRNRFEMDRDMTDCLDILLFSEVGSEGLDYQFCDCIVNYDLPWNPMRIEQRIGRIDRKGQRSRTVAIYNLITPDTVDADIYERCLTRIGVFNHAIGGSEEILGEITREIKNIAESFNLSKDDRRKRLQQLADNKIRLIQEQEDLEQKQSELFGIQIPQEQMRKEIEDATSFWLSPFSVNRLVNVYLQKNYGKEQEFILGEKSLKTLRLSQEIRNKLLHDYHKIPRQSLKINREWEGWLKGDDPHLQVTFDSETASRYQVATFIMPIHPLVKQAANSFIIEGKVFTSLRVSTDLIPEGQYGFVIYQWKFLGIREDMALQPVTNNEDLSKHLTTLIERAEDDDHSDVLETNSEVWDELDAKHYELWFKAREKHQEKTRELIEYRRESLTISHKARISLLKEQLAQATNDNIQRMRQSQINNAEADFDRHIKELDMAIEKADITAEPVAYGVISIVGGQFNGE
jgi:superfamily II DNA or RNA helicase